MKSKNITRCGGIIFNKYNDSVLVVLNKDSKAKGENKWGFPKGHRKQNEKLVNCARREIREETGILLPFEMFKKRIYIHNSIYFIIFLRQDYHTFNVLDKNEIAEVGWKKLDELISVNYNRDIRKFIEKNESSINFDFCESQQDPQKEQIKTIIKNNIISV